ncbi:MAG: glucosamine-6-phosphate deaminase [Pirellula sp.]|nr:glucosamine-6-phosphate deaminase [Pirellula sp.]
MHTLTKLSPCAGAARVSGTRLPCYVFSSNVELARTVAQAVARVIRERAAAGQKAVIGLTTGSTPLGIYRELIRMHRDEDLDFSNVVTFNPDEYYGVPQEQLQSRRHWMQDHFFAHVNIPPAAIHFLDGATPPADVDDACRRFDEAIDEAGGIDIQLLGIGRNGHIAANEPFGSRHGRTRLVTLDPLTRKDAADDFFGDENVPMQALTLGIDKLFEARKVFLVALGGHKAKIIREAVEGPAIERVPASFLQQHPDATVLVDSAAGDQLTGLATPWVAGPVEWTDAMIRRAVLWLSLTVNKPLLKLDDDDFRSQNLHQLLALHGPAHAVCHRVFRMQMDTINYHPGGKDPQRVICFSPHPDDDVISMGGALIRLVEDRHEVHIAYMTSGNIAVFDHDARQVAHLVTEYNRLFGIDTVRTGEVERCVHESLAEKRPGQPDGDAVRKIKALIRWSEAKAGAQVVGCREEHLHFLDLPFYRTGTVAKNPVGDDDVRIIRELLERVRPGQVYIAGDLSDPHGTHRVCAAAIFRALWEMEQQTGSRPEALLYRGAWQEWAPHEIEIAVPLSPRDLELKKQAIFRHESQKDSALFPGSDSREFWQRAEDRNRGTADVYNRLGLPEYYALEGFVRWNGRPL